jgi:hypothetical protein
VRYNREWPFSVYLIVDAKNDRVKIGHSAVPKRRLHQLQSACPDKLSLELVIMFRNKDAAEAFERHLHNRFESLQIHGEWFEEGADIFESIQHDYAPSPERIKADLQRWTRDIPDEPIKQRELWVMLKTIACEAEETDEADEVAEGVALLTWCWYEDEAAVSPEAIAQANAFEEYGGLAA